MSGPAGSGNRGMSFEVKLPGVLIMSTIVEHHIKSAINTALEETHGLSIDAIQGFCKTNKNPGRNEAQD